MYNGMYIYTRYTLHYITTLSEHKLQHLIQQTHSSAGSHHEGGKLVEDVGHGEENGGFSVEFPRGTVLLHQPLLLDIKHKAITHNTTHTRCYELGSTMEPTIATIVLVCFPVHCLFVLTHTVF